MPKLEDLMIELKARGNFGHAGRPGKHGGSAPKSGGGSSSSKKVESKSQISGILKKAGFSAAKLAPAGKVRGSRSYAQGGYEIDFTSGPRGNSAFIKVVTSSKSRAGKIPSLSEMKEALEKEGFTVKETNWEGGGLDVR